MLSQDGEWLLAVDHCKTNDERTTLVRVVDDGGWSTAMEPTNPRAVVGTSLDEVWVASARDGGTVVERHESAGLAPNGLLAYVAGLEPADVVHVLATDGGFNSLYLVGASSGLPVTLGGVELVPAGRVATVVIELKENGELRRFGWLDVERSQPARGGAAWAQGRLWVTGSCRQNNDGGGLQPCDGTTDSAYLFSVGP